MRQTYSMLALILLVVFCAHMARMDKASVADQKAMSDINPTIDFAIDASNAADATDETKDDDIAPADDTGHRYAAVDATPMTP